MKEAEAERTRCCGPEGCGDYGKDGPIVTVGRHDEVIPLPGQPRWCIASKCMGWRWAVETYDSITPAPTRAIAEDRIKAMLKGGPANGHWVGGYCGHAGPP